jgi:hypothetical protein
MATDVARTQAKAKAVLQRQMRHVLFTEPADVQAGGQVTLYYNPADTPLSGAQQVFLTARAPFRAARSQALCCALPAVSCI